MAAPAVVAAMTREMRGGACGGPTSSRGRPYCLRGERERDLERDLERLLLLLPIFTSFLKLKGRAVSDGPAGTCACAARGLTRCVDFC